MLLKKEIKNPERFGKGAIEGVAGPESANNSALLEFLILSLLLGSQQTSLGLALVP
jgi:putative tricarboxylic transport membrane protein